MFGRGFSQGYGGAGGPGGAGEGYGGYGQMGGGIARGAHGAFPGGGVLPMLFALVVIAVIVFAFWQLFKKSGHNGALSLLMLIPVVNVGALLYLALSEWPALKELAAWRTWYASTQTPATPVAPVMAPTVPVAPVPAPFEVTSATPEPPEVSEAKK